MLVFLVSVLSVTFVSADSVTLTPFSFSILALLSLFSLSSGERETQNDP